MSKAEQLEDVRKEARALERRLVQITEPSYTTPCQITGEPGIDLLCGAKTVPVSLSPKMWDEFDRRMQDTTQLAAANFAHKALFNFEQEHTIGDAVGDYDICGERLELAQKVSIAKTATGFAAIRILREMEKEYGNSPVSSSESDNTD